jgi:hypothetical protein
MCCMISPAVPGETDAFVMFDMPQRQRAVANYSSMLLGGLCPLGHSSRGAQLEGDHLVFSPSH